MSSRPAEPTAPAIGHESRVRALFDIKAAGWPDKYADDGPLVRRLALFAAAVDRFAVPGGDVLDLGCGTGELARQLAAAGYRVTGCDIAPQMLRQAVKADAGRTVSWQQLKPGWRALPFETATVDVVLASSVLEYVQSPGDVLAECARLLRAGGVLLCTVPSPAHPVRWVERPLRAAARTRTASVFQSAIPRFAQYVSYLQATPQPRSVSWWQTVGRQSGLEPAAAPGGGRQALRLLAFTRTRTRTEPAGNQPVHRSGEEP